MQAKQTPTEEVRFFRIGSGAPEFIAKTHQNICNKELADIATVYSPQWRQHVKLIPRQFALQKIDDEWFTEIWYSHGVFSEPEDIGLDNRNAL